MEAIVKDLKIMDSSKLKAFGNVEIAGMLIRGFKLFGDGDTLTGTGKFDVAPPQRKANDGRWYNVLSCGTETKEVIRKALEKSYLERK